MKTRIRSLDCEKVRDMMFEYIDGELSAADAFALEAHVALCDECRRELDERREMLLIIKESGNAAGPDLLEKIMSATEGVAQEKRRRFAGFRFAPAGTLVAACAVFAVLVVGRGYLFGGASLDAVDGGRANEERVGRYYLADEAYEEVLALSDAAAGAVLAVDADEAAFPAEAVQEIEPDDAVYSVTTATVKADGPVMMKSAGPKVTECYDDEEISELDLFIEATAPAGSAVIVCFESSDLPELGEPLERELCLNGQICDLYMIPSEPILAYDRVSGSLSDAGIEFRSLIPDGEEIRGLAVYVLHREN